MTRLLLWIPALSYMAVIFILSSIPDLGTLPGGASDKTWHFAGYAGLGVTFLLPLAAGRLGGVTWSTAAGAILLATLYGLSDEFHQTFVPGRSAEALDVVADSFGATLGVGLVGLAAGARAWGILKSSSHPSEPRQRPHARRH